MIKFLFKGIIRDKNRSLLPIIIITIGVALTILLSGYLRGVMGDVIDQNARFETGHVKIMTQAYTQNKDQLPNDLALLKVNELVQSITREHPEVHWVKRIKFGGLIDVPGENETSKGQGPASGIALELFDKSRGEETRMNIPNSIVSGSIPDKPGEALIGHDFASKLNVNIGDEITYMGSTMNGSLAFASFVVSGTVRFGVSAMDKGTIILDISDAQKMLDMDDGAGEVLGYLKSGIYQNDKAIALCNAFNQKHMNEEDEFSPKMIPLRDQNNLASMLDYVDVFSSLFVTIFVFAMSIVLWNTGLLGGLRRYQEFGIRLALGEEKRHIYGTLIYEAVLIGIIGSVIGTTLGIGGVYYLQVVGINVEGMMTESTMMMPTILRAQFTPELLYIGFIPGLFAMVFGNMLSGIGIYKRETATLFKELEV
ncbi:MAG: FtsX-like permease family protein [Cyclobacteriaceae bacterium]|nr:FtsX-like permease family protein [Cyclobacteriaceae bacterium]